MADYINFTARHNMDLFSIDNVTEELSKRLNKRVIEMEPINYSYYVEKEILPDCKFASFDDVFDEDVIKVCDEFLISREMIKKYGKEKSRQIMGTSYEESAINNYWYNIYLNNEQDKKYPQINNLKTNTILGSPAFPNIKWHYFDYIIKLLPNIQHTNWLDFIEERKKIYECIKPLYDGTFIYYHTDQGEGEVIGEFCRFEEIEPYAKEHDLKIFNLTEFILNPNSKQKIDDPYCYIIKDDFKDILILLSNKVLR